MLALLLTVTCLQVNGRDIYFCGEAIPVNNDFVAQKLMNVIRNQMPYANMASLRQKALAYFPYIEECLRENGIPEDFKYLPIVESGFANLSSNAGARGFWQLLPATAKQFDLVVTSTVDERDDYRKATPAACKMILQMYNYIRGNTGASSWVLAAASYNFGVGNVMKAVRKQGADYFSMDLNPETAEYVYKIIAIKELFENPEFYMGSFGTNVFRDAPAPAAVVASKEPAKTVKAEFASMQIKVGKAAAAKPMKTVFVAAHLITGSKKFSDGELLSIMLDTDLNLSDGFTRRGNTIKGTGWIIDGRVYIDLGFGPQVQVMDGTGIKGVQLANINSAQQYLLLRTEVDI